MGVSSGDGERAFTQIRALNCSFYMRVHPWRELRVQQQMAAAAAAAAALAKPTQRKRKNKREGRFSFEFITPLTPCIPLGLPLFNFFASKISKMP